MCRHEIAGVVTEVGKNAEGHFKIGEHAGVGCLVRACATCELCQISNEQYCSRLVFTYSAKDWGENDSVTCGGYSNRIVLNHRFAITLGSTTYFSTVGTGALLQS